MDEKKNVISCCAKNSVVTYMSHSMKFVMPNDNVFVYRSHWLSWTLISTYRSIDSYNNFYLSGLFEYCTDSDLLFHEQWWSSATVPLVEWFCVGTELILPVDELKLFNKVVDEGDDIELIWFCLLIWWNVWLYPSNKNRVLKHIF